jgi:hypothetical protein
VLADGVEQRDRLQAVARGVRPALLDRAARVDRVLHGGDDQPLAQLLDAAVAELDHLGEVVAGVDVHHREREAARVEGLLGEAQQHDRVLAAREQQHRPLELRGDLAHHVDRLGLELTQLRQAQILLDGGQRWASSSRRYRSAHSRDCAPDWRRIEGGGGSAWA